MKRVMLYYLILLLPVALKAQDITLQAEYPSIVEAGKQFSVTWTVNSGGGEFSEPSFEGFYKLMGPNTSYSSSTQIINGRMTHETSYSYVYYLQAVNEGKFVIPPASVTIKNRTYYSDSLRIEVMGGAVQQPVTQPGGTAGQDNTQVSASRGEIFLDLSVSRRDLYIGEHLVATVKLFTRVNLSGINERKYPSFTGFLKTDLELPPLTSLRQENINGTIYGTGILQQFLLYPQITGEITIEPYQATVLVQQKTGRSDPFFGDFFSTYQTIPQAVVSKSVTINVKPLPGNKPDDFSGIVGSMSLKAGISKDTVNVNDAVNFRITVSGNGNLKLAEAPAMKLPADVEMYDPKITDNLKNTAGGTSGQKTFEYLLIPRHYGDFTIPPIAYSYFNTTTRKYERLTTDEFRFHARKGTEEGDKITVYGGISKEDVKYVGKDIRFIRTDPGKLSRPSNILMKRQSFYSGYAIALGVFLLVLFIRREHIRRNADLTAVKNRKAGRVAVKRLKEASVCLKKGETDRFFEEILKAIWGYLSDKLNIPVSELTRNNAVTALQEEGIDEEKIRNLTEILDKCEYARYAPSESGSAASDIYEGASRFIRSVENSRV
jgi:hypothetical protein